LRVTVAVAYPALAAVTVALMIFPFSACVSGRYVWGAAPEGRFPRPGIRRLGRTDLCRSL
jgi:hypothetical protein